MSNDYVMNIKTSKGRNFFMVTFRVSYRNSISRNCSRIARNCAELRGVYSARNCAQVKSISVGNTRIEESKDDFTKKRIKRLKRVKYIIKHIGCQKTARIKKNA